jgi:diguanylate cyclase (GGDEF)-like protein
MTSAAPIDRTEVEAITDGLTGLYNHRYFHERLGEELDRCADHDGRLALLFCDLDDFHAFNELHGHSAGDDALRAVARVIEGSVRHIDLAARYGGEEFAAILLDTDESGAREVAERIRAGILEMGLAAGAEPLSVSIGVAACPADATFKEELIDKTDWAMYLAKRSGRNQVMTFAARHGSDTPEGAASVSQHYVSAMTELVAARDVYEQRRVSAVAHLSEEVGRELGLDATEVRAAAGAAGAGSPAGPLSLAQRIVTLADAYQSIVMERPYRPQLSEAEALDEFLCSPALRDHHGLAAAFAAVLGRDSRV